MARIVKEELLGTQGLGQIDVTKKDNLFMAKQVELGYATKLALSKCKVSEKNMLRFQQECRSCLPVFVQKLLGDCPLKYPLSKARLCLNMTIASEHGGKTHLKSAL
ncbi:hypothetical protein PR048_014516 [Dryococelus australis]|uniref:Uncharacterized protein n=1 Tax=Dryococelus australis TaxID=614101 RepID=A0ABQ9HEG8_9NEOP|nr:hypothetical protein PR048_014516 [Dryococelus australis]